MTTGSSLRLVTLFRAGVPTADSGDFPVDLDHRQLVRALPPGVFLHRLQGWWCGGNLPDVFTETALWIESDTHSIMAMSSGILPV
jgi:hypothetical protein